MGRFKNVPTPIIFKSIKDGIEFHFKHGPQLLKSYINIAKYSVKHKVNITGIPGETIVSLLEPSIAQLGVQYLGVSTRSSGRDPGTELKESKEVYFGKLRDNAGLLELIGVYYGAIQLLVGATMAKRGSELRDLDPTNCLSEDKSWLIARIAKSSHGQKGRRARNARPIDPLAAEMVQTLIDFQKELIEAGFIDQHLPLFSSPGIIGTSSLTPCDVYLYYKNIDLFCDYFEVERDSQGRRYYIRQHQLRRFFALVFLHCGYGASAGILQWMFGHTDPAHIWNYITEELPGKELRNTLSQALSERIASGGATHYTDVIDLIESKFGTRSVAVMDAEKLADYFDFLMETDQMTIEPVFLESDTGLRVDILVVVRKKMNWDEGKAIQTASIENTRKLLLSVIATPSKYLDNAQIRDALISQASMAKLDLRTNIEGEPIYITPLSLNTFKQRSEERLPGGFSAIDSLRKNAALAINKEEQKPPTKNNRTREAILEQLAEANLNLDIHKRSNLILLQTLSDVRSKLDGVVSAKDEVTRKIRAAEILKRITAITSLNPEMYQIPSIQKAPVVSIATKGKKDD